MNLKRKTFLFISAALFLSLFTFNDLGLIKLYNLNSKKNEIRLEIDNLILQEIKLTNEIDRLLYDDDYIQYVAKTKYHLVKPGEKIYKVIERKNIFKK